MSCYRLTKHHCKVINSALSNFWWHSTAAKSNIHWHSWSNLCRPKALGGLGFRDISLFNQALLAKQAWRIHQSENSLLSEVYKDRYFRNSSLLDSSMGRRPSYAWRSIQHGKALLSKGLLTVIGNGESTSAIYDNWLFDKVPRPPATLPTVSVDSIKVRDLLDPSGHWSIPLLCRLFQPQEIGLILQISPSLSSPDTFIWPFTPQGSYSVKTGYNFIQQVNQTATPPTNITATRIWSIDTTPKIKFLWWRALTGALAVKSRLCDKHVPVSPLCDICKSYEETISHALFLCSHARLTLALAKITTPDGGYSHTDIESNLSFLLDLMIGPNTPAEIKSVIPWTLWNIWKNHNQQVFNRTCESPQSVLQSSIEEASHWRNIHQQNQQWNSRNIPNLLSQSEDSNHWQPPLTGEIKCNVHVTIRSNYNIAGISWLTRDHSGSVLHHARDATFRSSNATEAGIKTILWAAKSLLDLRYNSVCFESSIKSSIEAINNPKDWPRLRHCLKEIEIISCRFSSISFSYVEKQANNPAIAIASSVTRESRLQSYLSLGGPSWLNSLLLADKG